jgi:hypothetical protein
MALRFDATLKETVRQYTAGCAQRFGLPTGKAVSILNVDLSTISAGTDAAVGIGDPLEEIADFNFQSGPDAKLPRRALMYNSVLHHRYEVPVRSIIVLLRPKADHADLTGLLTYGEEGRRLQFQYEVIRLWQETPESFLEGSVGLLPLAVLSQLPADRSMDDSLKEIVRRIEGRLLAEVDRSQAAILMRGALILAGMRVEQANLADIFQGVGLMAETTAYDYLVEQGEIKRSHRLLIRLGRDRFEAPDSTTEAEINAITDLDRLERMVVAVRYAKNWQDLLNTP